MIIKPRVRGFICTTAHPTGCAELVERQTAWEREQPAVSSSTPSPAAALRSVRWGKCKVSTS